jgi:salicylate hydroxylase
MALPATLRLSHGDHLDSDLIIGADGLHSVARAALNGTLAPFFTGQVAWRATLPNRAGRGPRPGCIWARIATSSATRCATGPCSTSSPCRNARLDRGKLEPAGRPRQLARGLRRFRTRGAGDAGDVEEVHLWGLFRHPVAPRWHGEAVALLGDAAHPTLPFMAQGACMALEDAWVLAEALALPGVCETRLAAYQTRARSRRRKVVEAANGNAWKYHLANPVIRGAAHTAQPRQVGSTVMPKRMMRQFDWIYGSRCNAVEPKN